METAVNWPQVVAAKDPGAGGKPGGMQKPVCFSVREGWGGQAVGQTRGKIAGHVEGHAAEINWYSARERRTSRPSAWRTHEKSRIFGGHGCGLGAGRRPVTGYRPEPESWSAPPGP